MVCYSLIVVRGKIVSLKMIICKKKKKVLLSLTTRQNEKHSPKRYKLNMKSYINDLRTEGSSVIRYSKSADRGRERPKLKKKSGCRLWTIPPNNE